MNTGFPFLGAVLLATSIAGCIGAPSELDSASLPELPGLPALPVRFLEYHTAATFNEALLALETEHPELVDVLEVGRSVQGRPLLLAIVTNQAKRSEARPIAFIDGCHHGNEIQGCEAPLFAAKFLVENNARSAEVRWILDNFEVHLLPTVNADGRDLMTRVNANGINLNRNYGTDHGNPLGLSYPLGPPVTPLTWRQPAPWVPQPVAGLVPGNVPFQRPVRPSENGGWAPLSEPETRAVNNWLSLHRDNLAFYLTFHTSTHSIVVPWAAFNEPREIPPEHEAVFASALDWVNAHTTYKGGRIGWGDSSGNLSYAASGSSMDWAYDAYGVVSFTMETFIPNARDIGAPLDVNFWGDSSLVFILKLLMNTDKLQHWDLPEREFPYPEEWTGTHFFPEGAAKDGQTSFAPEL